MNETIKITALGRERVVTLRRGDAVLFEYETAHYDDKMGKWVSKHLCRTLEHALRWHNYEVLKMEKGKDEPN